MKLYRYLLFPLGVLIATGYVSAALFPITKKEYLFTLENKIRPNKTTIPSIIYGVFYEQLGASTTPRWKRLSPPFSLDFNKPYTVSLSSSNNYAYALGASDVMFDQEIISDQEKKALAAKNITATTIHKTITSLDFSLKNPLEVGVISLTNNYAYPIFVARYVFDTSKKGLNVELASTIKRCDSKETIDIVVPIGYKGSDVLLLAARTIDTLTASLDISKGALLISRSSFEKIKKGAPKNRYDASQFFAENTLTIVNDTSRDWTIGIYGKKGGSLQLLSEQKTCASGKKAYCNKNFFSPVSEYDYSSLFWVLFDADNTKIAPTVSLNYTINGGSVARDAKLVYLSKWFSEPKKDPLELTKEAALEDSTKTQDVQQDPQKAIDAGVNKDAVLVQQKESALQEAINGTFSFSLSNRTSKDIFAALYAQEKDQFQRREKPVKIPLESALPIGFEEKELLAFSVSHLELKESLSSFEWNNLNSIVPQEYKERECKIEQSNFKKSDSFDLAEITLKNDSYSDLAVGRYEYKKKASGGVLALCGVVQSIPKKSFDGADTTESTSDDAVKIAIGRPNFAVPQGYKGFIGYKNASDQKNFSSDLPTSIDTVSEFGMTHLGRIDTSDAMTFDVEKVLTGENILTVENDLGRGNKWVGLYDLDDRMIRKSLEILPGKKGEFIPYQEQMKLVVAERNFDASIRPQVPYGEILVNTVERLSYALTEAEMVTTEPDTVSNAQKDSALKIADLLEQSQQQIKQGGTKQEANQKNNKQNYKRTTPKDEIREIKDKTTQSKWERFLDKKPNQGQIKPQEILKEGACGPNQIRISNYSGVSISFRFYYRGFFSTTPVSNAQTYEMSNGQELCFNLPPSAYLDDRYVVIDQDFVNLKQSYSKQDVIALMREGQAFNLEKEKNITIKKINNQSNKK